MTFNLSLLRIHSEIEECSGAYGADLYISIVIQRVPEIRIDIIDEYLAFLTFTLGKVRAGKQYEFAHVDFATLEDELRSVAKDGYLACSASQPSSQGNQKIGRRWVTLLSGDEKVVLKRW
ncbi:hypothetical protein [Arthrobacter sp. CAN_A214]|uniref:hypothetical protein n=1 Tax=Arthrobacter sp. CAN_A214 TaxID=2787720 RepID=UPI0018C8DF24